MEIKIKKLSENAVIPSKMHQNDAGFDLYVPHDVVLHEGRQVIPLDFSIELEHNYAATIQPRSGFSSKGVECVYHRVTRHSVNVVNKEFRLDADVIRGLIDENYRGNVGVIINVHRSIDPDEVFVLCRGTRIAQMQIVRVPEVTLTVVDKLSDTERGDNGYGSTGSKSA